MDMSALISEFNSKKQALEETVRNAMPTMFKDIFDANPTLMSFTWSQYTPYWCDGDTCEFGCNDIHEYTVQFADGTQETVDAYDGKQTLSEAIDKAQALIHKIPDNILQDAIGDHIQVTIHRSGKMDIQDYEHDIWRFMHPIE